VSRRPLLAPALGFAHGELRGALRRGFDASKWPRGERIVAPFPAGLPLSGRVAVLSPHLDDAVLSLGAAISAAAAAGAEVDVVTVLAGDPTATDPPGAWDRSRGFASAAEAASARREEDRRACEMLGARPVWLPFKDHQYPARAEPDEVWAAIEEAIRGATSVLVPGAPLVHEDHLWLAMTVLERGLPADVPVGLYLEQPYAVWAGDRAEVPEAARSLVARPLHWSRLASAPTHRWRKARASGAYASQLTGLSSTLLQEVTKYEARRGGEALAWVT
jgi:LmbE family N-acetylglucosaminyl deacetylase